MISFEWFDTVPWNDNRKKEVMYCTLLCTNQQKEMSIISEIDKEKEEGVVDHYFQFEVSFDQNKKLVEVHVLIQDLFKDDCGDMDLIGLELYDDNGEIIGHTLLSDEEFKELISKAREEFEKNYDSYDWTF